MVVGMIALVIIILSLAAAGVIVVRKFPQLAILNVETIPGERTAQVKRGLLERRLQRIFAEWKLRAKKKMRPAARRVQAVFKSWRDRLLEMYEHLRKAPPKTAVERDTRIKEIMARAGKLAAEGEYAAAEKAYIEILKLDSRNTEAYRSLGDLYMQMREHEQARETYEFLLKFIGEDAGIRTQLGAIAHSLGDYGRAEREYLRSLTLAPHVAETYADLGFTYEAAKELEKASANFLRAVELEPNNPRYLDFLLETSILVENLPLAKETFEKLRLVNPENNKLSDFRRRIRVLEMKRVADESLRKRKQKSFGAVSIGGETRDGKSSRPRT